ncbi:protein kinase-like domain, concanavalin A-like lectin/glucanase domain protein [Tanacetum coccineum]
MENANPSSRAPKNETLSLEKKLEVELWLDNSKRIDSIVSPNRILEEKVDEEEEEEDDDLEYFNTFPTLEELKQAYIDLESLINVIFKLHCKCIMSKGLESRKKPSNPMKISNFVGRVRGLKVFIGNFTYEYDFVVLEDTTSIIDHYLGEVVFGKPFIRETGLVYDKENGTVMFEKDNEKIT